VAGPLDGVRTNRLDNIKIILRRGFDVPLQIVDGKTGEPVAGAKVATMFSIRNSGFQTYFWESRKDGIVSLTHCADLPLNVEVNASGYEIARQDFEHLRAGEPLRLVLRRGAAVSGIVLDKRTGQPISGAEIHMLYQSSAGVPLQFRWEDPFGVLGHVARVRTWEFLLRGVARLCWITFSLEPATWWRALVQSLSSAAG
jgi:hypothetical protein